MGMFLLHAFSMPVAFAKFDEERSWAWAVIPGLHTVAALSVSLQEHPCCDALCHSQPVMAHDAALQCSAVHVTDDMESLSSQPGR